MNFLEAKKILELHSGWSEDSKVYTNTRQNFLTSSLRPFEGKLIHDSDFQEIKNAIYCVYNNFREQPKIDREIIKYINSIIRDVYVLALRENSPIRRNNLISEMQLKTLKKWNDEYAWMFHYLLMDLDPIENMKDDI